MDMQAFSLYFTVILFLPRSLFGFVLRTERGDGNDDGIRQNSVLKFRRSLTMNIDSNVVAKVDSSSKKNNHMGNFKVYFQTQGTRTEGRKKHLCARHPYLCDLAWHHHR